MSKNPVQSVERWMMKLNVGKFTYINPCILALALSMLGADFSRLTEDDIIVLGEFSNSAKGPVINKIWGTDWKTSFSAWVKEWAKENDLPTLKGGGSNFEGLKALMYETTAYAAGAYNWPRFAVIEKARMFNWQQRFSGYPEKEYRFHIYIPGYNNEKPFAPASFPPIDYARDLWQFLVDQAPK